ncbi:MAG: DASS family sodium-coupled anion symporter [Saprospiraceae bacterium]
MSDSRHYSKKFYDKIFSKVERQNKTILFLLSALISLILVLITRDPSFNTTQDYVLYILFFSIGLWVTEAIPPFAVGILIVGFLVFTMGQIGNMNVNKYIQTWSDGVIWLFLGGFFLAEGLKKTKLDVQFLQFTIPKLGDKASNILLGFMFITAVLSMVMSNTATTVMVLASMAPILYTCQSSFQKALLLGVAGAASFGGMGTIIGSAPNAIAVGAIESLGMKISFIEWMVYGVPTALFLTLIFWYILTKKFDLKNLTLDLSKIHIGKELSSKIKEEKNIDKKIVLFTFITTLLFWLSSEWTNIPVAAVSGIPIVFLTMMGIIDADDVRSLPWDTLMLVAGGMALGIAVQEQGLVNHFMGKINGLEINTFSILFLFAFISVIVSNFMSNTAAVSILLPVGVSLAAMVPNLDPGILPITIGLCASCALLLPVSTPPNAVAHSYGKLDQKDYLLGGVSMGFIGPILIILWLTLTKIIF